MSPDSVVNFGSGGGYCDTLSCLRADEHFSVGCYGNPVNLLGCRQGIENLCKFLKPGGRLYLSTPIGQERVKFNGNWAFNPGTILDVANSVRLRIMSKTQLDRPA